MNTHTPTTDQAEPRASIFTVEQERGLRQLKAHFPYRIVWGAVDQNGNFEMHTSHTRHKLNKYLRDGWLVATCGS